MADLAGAWALADALESIRGEEPSREDVATVTRVDPDGSVWVRLLGTDIDSPVNGALASSVAKGQRVLVRIEDGRLSVLGNPSEPSVGASYVERVVVPVERMAASSNEYISALKADSIEAQDISAMHGDFGTVKANAAKVGSLTADELTATVGYVEDLVAENVTASDISADHATVGALDATYASIGDLTAANARIDTLESTKADISVLESDYITADAIEANYLHADMSNADVAWIQNGVIKDGSISNAMINSLSANKLTAGTINGSVINVTNLNADNITAGTINGQRIGEGSLSLDKLSEDVYTEQEVDNKLATMQAEIDGAIETWTGTAVPTLNNSPASDWTTAAVRDTHVGDVYFVVNSQSEQNGYNYRFTKSGNTYSWQLIKDSDVTNALQRLSTAEGKITTFDSDISTLKTDTGTLKTKTESLETRMSDAEDDILDKVDTTTFNEVSDTVDQHSQSITQMSQTLSNKADGSTVTALTTRVSKTEQDITGINTTIGELQDTVETKADGSTVSTISNKLNTVSDTVDGHTQTLTSVQNTLSSKADSSTVSTLTTKVNNVSDTVDGHTAQLSSITTTQTSIQGSAVKSTVQLWFTKANTTAPSKPTAHVTTNNASTANAWNLAVPTYNSSYPYYYYCYEHQLLNDTYTWSAVTRDIATEESQSTSRSAASAAAAADTKAGNAASAAAAADMKAGNAAAAAATADGKAVSAQNTADKNVRESQQLWYTKANSTAPAKPTSKVTSTATTGGAWTTRVPTYSDSYKHYFYCMQYVAADGTVTWSDVIYDQATTEAQSVARAASADLTEFHQEYATFKQTTQEFESTVGETYATKNELKTTDDKIENLEIGGRNLFGYGSDCESLAGMNNSGFEVVTKDGYTCAHASGALKTVKYLYSKIPFTPRPKEYVTISGYVQINNITEGTTNPMCEFYPSGQTLNGTWRAPSLKAIYIDGVNTGSTYSVRFHRNISDTDWHHFAAVYQWPNYEFTASRPPAVYLRDCTGDLYVHHIKYERGNKATDWTPAPEDLDAHFESVETAIEQNAEAIKLSATKEEVEKTYSTKDESKLDRSASGTSADIDGAANAALKGLHVIGESVQDGTPSPSSPVPIVSVGAMNLIDYQTWYDHSNTTLSGDWLSNIGTDTKTYSSPVVQTALNGTWQEAFYVSSTNVTSSGKYSRMFTVTKAFDSVRVKHNGSAHDVVFTYKTITGSAGETYYFEITFGGTNPSVAGGMTVCDLALYRTGSYRTYIPYGALGLCVRSKNLLDLSDGLQTNTQYGVTITKNDDGSYSLSGTATQTGDISIMRVDYSRGGFMSLQNGLTYTFKAATSTPSNSVRLTLRASNMATGAAYKYFNSYGESDSLAVSADNLVLTALYFNVVSGTNTDGMRFYPQLEVGAEATDFKPYSESVTPIPMDGHELRSLPDGTQDELTIDVDGHVTMTQRIGSITFNGASGEGWTYGGNRVSSGVISSAPTAIDKNSNNIDGALSNRYQLLVAGGTGTAGNLGFTFAQQKIYLRDETNATNLATWTSYLGSNQTVFDYLLATPQTIDLGTIDMPQVKDGDTVEVIAALTPSIDVTWWASAGQAVADAYASLSSAIEVKAESIVSTVSERYATSQEVQAISSQITQTAQGWTAQFNQLTGGADLSMTLAEAFDALGVTSRNLEEIRSFVRITTDDAGDPLLLMGSATSPIMLALSNDSLRFMHGSDPVAYIDVDGTNNEGRLHITRAVVVKELQFGSWKWFERDGVGNLALKWVGDE